MRLLWIALCVAGGLALVPMLGMALVVLMSGAAHWAGRSPGHRP